MSLCIEFIKIFFDSELGTFVLDTDNPHHFISISALGTFNLRIYKNYTFPYLLSYSSHDTISFNQWLGQ